MDLGIRGRNAIVCAASKGLGKGCAMSLAKEGVNLVITARGREALEATAAEIRKATGAKVVTVAGDIATPEGRAAALAACPAPDILVNNAGGPPPGDFRNWSREDWLKAIDANMLTPIELIKATLDGMIARKFGRVVNITSSAVKAPIAELGLSNGARTTDRRANQLFGRDEFRPIIDGITIGLQVLLVFIGALTLGIGGVGVANIMLVSVDERVREIGLRRALGARKRHIRLQFLAEALVLTMAGGAAGIVLSYAVTALMPILPVLGPLYQDDSGKGDMQLRISALTVLGSSLILVFVGMASGLVPALKASRLDPVEALRYECTGRSAGPGALRPDLAPCRSVGDGPRQGPDQRRLGCRGSRRSSSGGVEQEYSQVLRALGTPERAQGHMSFRDLLADTFHTLAAHKRRTGW